MGSAGVAPDFGGLRGGLRAEHCERPIQGERRHAHSGAPPSIGVGQPAVYRIIGVRMPIT